LTLLAPTNQAIEKWNGGPIEKLTDKKNLPKLKAILQMHIIEKPLDSKTLLELIKSSKNEIKITNAYGETLVISLRSAKLMVKTENNRFTGISETDRIASNGVIHQIDALLEPKP
jgi:uncharacterized surface protein with fasciclin (FAS1) repeats